MTAAKELLVSLLRRAIHEIFIEQQLEINQISRNKTGVPPNFSILRVSGPELALYSLYMNIDSIYVEEARCVEACKRLNTDIGFHKLKRLD